MPPTETQHTPRPWNVMTQNLRPVSGDPRNPEMWQVPIQWGNVVAIVYGPTTSGAASKAECVANAELICRAVNSFDDLFAACQAWANYFDKLDRTSHPDDDVAKLRNSFHAERINLVRAAIAKAKGQQSAPHDDSDIEE